MLTNDNHSQDGKVCDYPGCTRTDTETSIDWSGLNGPAVVYVPLCHEHGGPQRDTCDDLDTMTGRRCQRGTGHPGFHVDEPNGREW